MHQSAKCRTVSWLLLAGCLLFAAYCRLPSADSPLRADDAVKLAGPPSQVPYRLSSTNHVVVRVRINGKGPFNFIVDTGSPALFINTAVARKLDVEADKSGWAAFERFELEGGVVVPKARARIEDLFQLQSMNRTGLAGIELHGVLGYNVLAHYRVTYDFAQDKLTWQRLNFEPPPLPNGFAQKAVDALAMAQLKGPKMVWRSVERGFLGVELAEKENTVIITNVLKGGPAAAAKLESGDRIVSIHAKPVQTIAEVHRLIAPWKADEPVEMTIERKGARRSVKAQLGKGL